MSYKVEEYVREDGTSPYETQMALTRDFKDTIKKRVECDPDFAKALLHEAIDLMLDGDSVTAKLVLRDLVNATVGFERLVPRNI